MSCTLFVLTPLSVNSVTIFLGCSNFKNAYEFVKAFDDTQRQWTATSRDQMTSTWFSKVVAGYKKFTGEDLL